MKNVVILSGGSGNTALLEALYSKPEEYKINIIINQTDHGKSTGICSEVTNTLGVSDARKNHYKVFKYSNKFKDIDEEYAKAIYDLFEGRYDIDWSDENSKEEVRKLLTRANYAGAIIYVERFFNRLEAKKYTYKSFNIMNIVYSQMYTEFGYEETHKKICDFLGIKDNVILNSFDNVKLLAKTASGHVIEDEGDIVEWKNIDDPIVDNLYIGHHFELNPRAIKTVEDADIIIISSGTFWSSIFPTLQYLDFYKHINESNAKKIWIMNTNEDKDAYGVTSQMFTLYLAKLGLDLSDFTILENLNAVESLRMSCLLNENIVETELGNNNGKHDPKLLLRAVEYILEN